MLLFVVLCIYFALNSFCWVLFGPSLQDVTYPRATHWFVAFFGFPTLIFVQVAKVFRR